jgi:hypothetical protein
MKTKGQSAAVERGLQDLDRALKQSRDASTHLFGPLMERNSQSERIRLALGMLGRWRFFFNLPMSLETNIRRKKFDKVARDYKKGKTVMQENQQLRTTVTGADAQAVDSQQKVFDKVWTDIENIAEGLRQELFTCLTDPWAPLAQQEQAMEYVLWISSLTAL